MIFVADIPRDTRVWLSQPKIGIPERNVKQGRHPIREKVLDGEPAPIEVQKIKDQIDPAKYLGMIDRELNTYLTSKGRTLTRMGNIRGIGCLGPGIGPEL